MSTGNAPLKVFWQPGCSSCLRAKEFLTEHGIAFRSIDVLNDEGGLAALSALGVRNVPIVARGNAFVSGQILRDVAAFAGIEWRHEVLPPEALKTRIDGIIAGALRFSAQLPEAHLDDMLPNRPRSYRDLACHIFQIVEAFVDESEGDPLTDDKYARPAPDGVAGVGDITRLGETIRARFAAWWDGSHDFSRPADCYYGDQTLQDFMERTAWHAGQHTRQMMLVLEKLGVAPEDPMTDADFSGLPMPREVWDDEKRWD